MEKKDPVPIGEIIKEGFPELMAGYEKYKKLKKQQLTQKLDKYGTCTK